jgi:Na+/melibiose symporter-like transporter
MEIIFFRLEDRYSKLKNKAYMNKLRTWLITIVVTIESLVVLLIPNFTLIGMVLPMILIPSLLGIVYIFYLAYRLQRLSVVKPKILTIGFFIYLISNIFRPVMQNVIGESASYIIIVEFVDLIIFGVIFLGLYKRY